MSLPNVLAYDRKPPRRDLIATVVEGVAQARPIVGRAPDAAASRRRSKIWELSPNLYCSIIGTCLGAGDLRQILIRAGIEPSGSEHELHGRAVGLAAKRDGAAKLINKALDRRHTTAIARMEKAADEAALKALWAEAVRRGEVAGAYWAALTHPAMTDRLAKEIFGEVHMLSHLAGAASRAELRRIARLEEENASLAEKAMRQERHLREAIVERDARLAELREALGAAVERTASVPGGDTAGTGLAQLVVDLRQRLDREARRRAHAEERRDAAVATAETERRRRTAVEAQATALAAEIEAIESSLRAETAPSGTASPRLDGVSVLYVGGVSGQAGHLHAIASRVGAALLLHDGGAEERGGLLGGLVSRADVVLFPVDCVSHEAMLAVKRHCRAMGKPFMPLRSAGLTTFLGALRRLAAERAVAAAE